MGKKVAVIGSGFAGLAAASLLAQKGCAVELFEKNQTLGGRARHFQASGLTFDMGPSWYWMPEVFQQFFALFGKQVSDYYQLEQLDPSFVVYFGKDDKIEVPACRQELFALFEAMEPGSAKNLEKFLEEAALKYEIGMQRLVYKPGLSWREFAEWNLVRSVFKLNIFQSFHRYVRRFFNNPKLIRLMEFPVLFLGGMPSNTPALYSLMNHAELNLGTWYPMGGMRKIIEAMVELAQAQGVQIHTGSPVDTIQVNAGVATGIQRQGAFVEADAIVAGADYHHVEQELLEAPWRQYNDRYWQSRTLAPSSLIFYLGVGKKLQKLAHHNLFFHEDLDRHADQLYKNPSWPSHPLFYVCCPSKTDASVAPEGCENVFVLVPIAPGLSDGDDIRELYFDKVLSQIEHIAGERLGDSIFFKRSYAVRDFCKDYNAFRGNAYGLANTLRQTAIFKPSLASRKVKNLYFAGQLTVPGPGVPPSLISGQVAARQILNSFAGNGS